ncbi:MAG: HNH endonuclease [Candidatus Heimdallarchaeota archaeon]
MSKKNGKYIACVICGKEKYYQAHQLKIVRDRVCSKQCYAHLMKKNNTGRTHSDITKTKLREKFQTGKYIECEICGNKKYYPIYKIKLNDHCYCSFECRSKGMSIHRVGKYASHFIDGRTDLYHSIRGLEKYSFWRKQVLNRDRHMCQDCGQIKDNLEVHHTKPFRIILNEFLSFYNQFSPIEEKEILLRLSYKWTDFWNINCGITYCDKCHAKNDKYRGIRK